MAKAKQNNLESCSNLAQAVTMIAAVSLGLLWAIAGVMQDDTLVSGTLGSILLWVTVVGGASMGLFYAFGHIQNRASKSKKK